MADARVANGVDPSPGSGPRGPGLRGSLLRLIPLVILAGVWVATPLRSVLEPERVRELAAPVLAHPWGPPAACLGVVVAAVVMVPVTPLFLELGAAVGAPMAFAVSYTGALVAAAAGWLVGTRLELQQLERRIPERLHARLLEGAPRFWSLAVLRLVPVAHFSIVNVVLGGVGIPFGVFLAATALGLFPVTLAWVIIGSLITA